MKFNKKNPFSIFWTSLGKRNYTACYGICKDYFFVIINSNERKAASNYSEIEDFELPEIGFDDFPDFDDFGLENGFLQNEE